MRESFLKLNDRTVVLAGPLNQVSSTIVTVMSERGCDVGFVACDRVNELQRFCENINDARQVHHNYGRAAVISSDLETEQACTDAIGRVAEIFGSIDIVIDLHLMDMMDNSDQLQNSFDKAKRLCQAAMPFVEGRNKGRIIYMTNDKIQRSFEKLSELRDINQKFSEKNIQTNITMNCISTGITEELLLKQSAGSKSIKEAFQEYEKQNGTCRIIEAVEIASVVSFVASPISSGLNGQVIQINAGAEMKV